MSPACWSCAALSSSETLSGTAVLRRVYRGDTENSDCSLSIVDFVGCCFVPSLIVAVAHDLLFPRVSPGLSLSYPRYRLLFPQSRMPLFVTLSSRHLLPVCSLIVLFPRSLHFTHPPPSSVSQPGLAHPLRPSSFRSPLFVVSIFVSFLLSFSLSSQLSSPTISVYPPTPHQNPHPLAWTIRRPSPDGSAVRSQPVRMRSLPAYRSQARSKMALRWAQAKLSSQLVRHNEPADDDEPGGAEPELLQLRFPPLPL